VETIHSTPTLENGRYARLAQAINLLSQVFQHISHPQEIVRLDTDSITQLERTLLALEQLAALEEDERKICCLSSISICYRSAILLANMHNLDVKALLTIVQCDTAPSHEVFVRIAKEVNRGRQRAILPIHSSNRDTNLCPLPEI
jgi:hypothetical protein